MPRTNLLLLLIASSALFATTSAQSPYEWSYNKDLPVLAIGLGAQVTGYLLSQRIEPLSSAEIDALDKNNINAFDRKATDYYSLNARRVSNVLMHSSWAVPVLLLADKPIRQDFLQMGVLTAEVVLINGATTYLTKTLSKRNRPFVYNPDVPLHLKMESNARTSFYSGHTSFVSSLTFFGAKVFSDYHPESRWKPLVWSVGALLPAVTAYTRVKGGKHFPTDVIGAYLAGGLVGYFVPHFHKKKAKEQRLSVSPFGGVDTVGVVILW
jgi:membrane-associated phospholipid phosphatase